MTRRPQVFLSHAGTDGFEASLLQFAVEHLLAHLGVSVWTYQRDQTKDEQDVAGGLKDSIRRSAAMIFLLSPATFEASGTQLMELAYAHAFDIPRYILILRLQYQDLIARGRGVPPLVLRSQCNDAALEWKQVIQSLGLHLEAVAVSGDRDA
jgi:hypothetical protein